MQNKNTFFAIVIIAFLVFLIFSPDTSITSATGEALMLSPASGVSGTSFTVSGTGFPPNSDVGIGFGAEVPIVEYVNSVGTFPGPFTANMTHTPIKPGTWSYNINVNNGLAVYQVYDNGTGVLTSSSIYWTSGTLNYATGKYIRDTTTSDPSQFIIVHTANYTSYQYCVTPALGINTNSTGGFTASITVPNVANGSYTITAVTGRGNCATNTFNLETPTSSPTPSPTPTASTAPSLTPSPTPSSTPILSPTASSTLSPIPTSAPTATSFPSPTPASTVSSSQKPTPIPSVPEFPASLLITTLMATVTAIAVLIKVKTKKRTI